MTQQYRLTCVDRYNNTLAELEGAQLTSCIWGMNDTPGEIKYVLPQNSPVIGVPLEHSNEVQLWLPGGTKPAHWGYHEDTSDTPRTAEFTCPGLMGYMGGRSVTNTSFYYGYDANHNPSDDGVEQMDIAAQLWAAKNYDFNIGVAPYTPSGVARYAFYDIFDHQNMLSDIFSQFPNFADAAGNLTGFDFDIQWDANGNRYLQMYYPFKGATLVDVLLEYGRNIIDYTIAIRGSAQSNNTYVTGGSNGDIRFENHALGSDDSISRYGHWESIQNDSDENDINVLLQRAQQYSSTHQYPLKQPEITVVEVPDRLLGVINPGDYVPIKIVNGRDNLQGTYRVATIEWLPGAGNLKLTLIDPTDQTPPVVAGSFRSYSATMMLSDFGPTVTYNNLDGP